MVASGVPPDPPGREIGHDLLCLQRIYAKQVAMFAAVIALAVTHRTLPPLETIQGAGELIRAQLSSLVRAPQLPPDTINMLIDTAAHAAPQCWIALSCFHRVICPSPADASIHDDAASYSIALNRPCLLPKLDMVCWTNPQQVRTRTAGHKTAARTAQHQRGDVGRFSA
jgi:hypothetical protein